jgi:hypothetical protein
MDTAALERADGVKRYGGAAATQLEKDASFLIVRSGEKSDHSLARRSCTAFSNIIDIVRTHRLIIIWFNQIIVQSDNHSINYLQRRMNLQSLHSNNIDALNSLSIQYTFLQ